MERLGDLSGATITADALHTQHEYAEYLHECGAHYMLTVKENQRALRKRISSQSWSTRPVHDTCREKGHGRTTTWQITAHRHNTVSISARSPDYPPDPGPARPQDRSENP